MFSTPPPPDNEGTNVSPFPFRAKNYFTMKHTRAPSTTQNSRTVLRPYSCVGHTLRNRGRKKKAFHLIQTTNNNRCAIILRVIHTLTIEQQKLCCSRAHRETQPRHTHTDTVRTTANLWRAPQNTFSSNSNKKQPTSATTQAQRTPVRPTQARPTVYGARGNEKQNKPMLPSPPHRPPSPRPLPLKKKQKTTKTRHE